MSGILPQETFDFIMSHELKRAARSQNFVTLVVMESGADVLDEIAAVVMQELRGTDLLKVEDGTLAVALLDTDLESSRLVVDRLMARLRRHRFSAPIEVSVGSACCPTHGSDTRTLWRTALAQKQPHSRLAAG
jgi:GGDEF domain-containing protein